MGWLRRLAIALRTSFPLWVLLLALAPGLLNLLPALRGSLGAVPPARVFVGFEHMVADHTQYLALARATERSGAIAVEDPFVTDPQSGRFVLLFVAAVGWCARLTGVDLVVCWYGLGVFVSWLFFLALWRLCCAVFETASGRRNGWLLASFGGGLAWAAFGLQAWTGWPERIEAEALWSFHNFALLNAALLPMWLAGYALVVVALLLLLRAGATSTDATPLSRRLLVAASAGLLLALAYLTHPYTGLAGLVLVGLWAALPWLAACWRSRWPDPTDRALHAPGWAGLVVGTVLIGVCALWARGDRVFALTSARALGWHQSYELWWYPVVYGVPLVLALFGIRRWTLAPQRSPGQRLVLVLLIGLVALAQCPWLPGLKFQFMVALPLGLAAAAGLQDLVERTPLLARLAQRPIWVALFWLLVAPGPLINLNRDMPPSMLDASARYVPQSELDLLAALHTLPPAGVLASPTTSSLVPWKADKPVYFGHWFMSIDVRPRLDQLRRFMDRATSDDERRLFLDAERIGYLVEDATYNSGGSDITSTLGLQLAFQNDFGSIWRRGR